MNEIPDAELRKFVAYSSDEEDEDSNASEAALSDANDPDSESEAKPDLSSTKKSRKKEDVIAKYKNLLNDISKKEEAKKKNKIEMEFSWGINTKESASKNDGDEKESNETELTPFEKIVEKKREKKRARKEKLRQLKKQQNKSDEEDSESEDDLPDGIDLNDPYFAEEFANEEFAPAKSKKSKPKKNHARNGGKNEETDDDEEQQKDLELLLDDDDHRAHFSLKKIQERENESKTSKKRRKKIKQNKSSEDKKSMEDDFQINTTDNRFAAIYSSHLFNIDPTDSHYRKTKAMETLIHEKLKRKQSNGDATNDVKTEEPSEKKRKNVADSILIKSIKRKVQQQQKQQK